MEKVSSVVETALNIAINPVNEAEEGDLLFFQADQCNFRGIHCREDYKTVELAHAGDLAAPSSPARRTVTSLSSLSMGSRRSESSR